MQGVLGSGQGRVGVLGGAPRAGERPRGRAGHCPGAHTALPHPSLPFSFSPASPAIRSTPGHSGFCSGKGAIPFYHESELPGSHLEPGHVLCSRPPHTRHRHRGQCPAPAPWPLCWEPQSTLGW